MSCDLAAAAADASADATWRFKAVLCHALRGQLRQNIVQVVGVGVAVARQVGHHLGFVVDAVPHHCVGLSGGAGRSHGEDEASHPRHLQQLQHLFQQRDVEQRLEPTESICIYFREETINQQLIYHHVTICYFSGDIFTIF